MSTFEKQFPEPPISKFLFASSYFSWVWLVFRLYVGWQWVMAGYGKVTSPLWVGPRAGVALTGFLESSLKKSTGAHPDVGIFYAIFLRGFVLHNTTVFSYIVSFGELSIGIALILGLFTGIAAFFGAFMNMNYLFAGALSINPPMFVLELFLILAWRVAGWYGLDRFLLPLLGVPWKPGKIFGK